MVSFVSQIQKALSPVKSIFSVSEYSSSCFELCTVSYTTHHLHPLPPSSSFSTVVRLTCSKVRQAKTQTEGEAQVATRNTKTTNTAAKSPTKKTNNLRHQEDQQRELSSRELSSRPSCVFQAFSPQARCFSLRFSLSPCSTEAF